MTSTCNTVQCHPVPAQWLEVETALPVLFTVLIGGEQGEVIIGEGGEEAIAEE